MGSMKMMKVWKLKHAPAAEVTEDTFELSVESIPTPSVGEVLVETIYLSNGK
jgi:NADPH-dependent curcumin reductase CurA